MRLFCWHKYKDVKKQNTGHFTFKFKGYRIQGLRLVQKCSKCNKVRYIKLSSILDEVLHDDFYWIDI